MQTFKRLFLFLFLFLGFFQFSLSIVSAIDLFAGENKNLGFDANAVIRNNSYFIKNSSTEQLVDHLIKDGNQAYCAAKVSLSNRFTNANYNRHLVLDMSKASVPLMRNENFTTSRLNSAENYYGNVCSSYDREEGTEIGFEEKNSMMVHSSWVAKSLPSQVACSMKVLNLVFLKNSYDACMDSYNDERYCLASRHQEILGTELTTKDLTDDLEQYLDFENPTKTTQLNKILGEKRQELGIEPAYEIAVPTPAVEGKLDNMTYCKRLLDPQQDNETEEDFQKRTELKKALLSMPFFSSKYYQTAYIVEAVKICEVNTTDRGNDRAQCKTPEHPCPWENIKDEIRVYPFKVPMLFNNKNFCDIDDPGYPENCVVHEEFPYHDPTSTYTDPATLNTNFLQTINQQQAQREKVLLDRIAMSGYAQAESTDSIVIKCANCGPKINAALVKIINATANHNNFSKEYFNEGQGDITCSDLGTAEISQSITTSAENPKEKGTADHKVNRFPESCCKFPLKRSPRGELCCREEEFPPLTTPATEFKLSSIISLEFWQSLGSRYQEAQSSIYDCVEKDDDFDYTRAMIRYWTISPFGDQLKNTEETILGSFYPENTYRELQCYDTRQNKRLALNGLTNSAAPLSIPGAGPITNIFLVQQSLYEAGENKATSGNSSAGLFKTLLSYRDINAYFSDPAIGGAAPVPPQDAEKDEIMNYICSQFGSSFGAEVAAEAIAIARAESGLDPESLNTIGAVGLFQIFENATVREQLQGLGWVYPGDEECTRIMGASNKKVECMQKYNGLSDEEMMEEIRKTEYYQRYSDIKNNVKEAIRKYRVSLQGNSSVPPWWPKDKPTGWQPWTTATGNGSAGSGSMFQVGRGNYWNNQNICVNKGCGIVVYNPSGDCGQSGKVGVDCSDTEVTDFNSSLTNGGVDTPYDGFVSDPSSHYNSSGSNQNDQQPPPPVFSSCPPAPPEAHYVAEAVSSDKTLWNKGDFTGRSLEQITQQRSYLKFWLYKPRENVVGLPLLIYLHGQGELENSQGADAFRASIPQYLKNGDNIEAVVLIPQLVNRGEENLGSFWEFDHLAVIKNKADEIVSQNKLNGNRIYLTGYSMGSSSIYYFLRNYPNYFAAVLPVSGPGMTDHSGNTNNPILSNLASAAKTPLRAYQGEEDTWFTVNNTLELINKLREVGGNAAIYEVKDKGHSLVSMSSFVFKQTEALNWLFSNDRSCSTTGGVLGSANPNAARISFGGENYVVVSDKLNDFVTAVQNQKIFQAADKDKYNDLCLNFSYYHAYKLFSGNYAQGMNPDDAAAATTGGGSFKYYNHDSKEIIIAEAYNQINHGRPAILHVNGNKNGTSRHYVTVVGYRENPSTPGQLKEEDLLIVDSYDGKLERMTDTPGQGKRFMITGYDTGRNYGHSLTYLTNDISAATTPGNFAGVTGIVNPRETFRCSPKDRQGKSSGTSSYNNYSGGSRTTAESSSLHGANVNQYLPQLDFFSNQPAGDPVGGRFTNYNYQGLAYSLWLPDGITDPTGLPIIVYLHGSGEKAGGRLNAGLPKGLSEGKVGPNAIILVPQSHEGNWNETEIAKVNDLTADLKGKFNSRHVTGSGFSNGGTGAIQLVANAPNLYNQLTALSGRLGYSGTAINKTLDALKQNPSLMISLIYSESERNAAAYKETADILQENGLLDGVLVLEKATHGEVDDILEDQSKTEQILLPADYKLGNTHSAPSINTRPGSPQAVVK